MPERRQRPIPVTDDERKFLEQQRAAYAQKGEESSDWGEFLAVAALLGAVFLGVYLLANQVQQSGQSASIVCPQCARAFAMLLPAEFNRYCQVNCPLCTAGLVVDLGSIKQLGGV